MIACFCAEKGKLACVDESHDSALDFFTNLNELGVLSGVAQHLNGPITTLDKFTHSSDLLVSCIDISTRKMLGYLRFGEKDLYFYQKDGKVIRRERCPCLLDFYVLESLQRSGIGRQLFDKLLLVTGLGPGHIAYDRPSSKLLPFLSRHYGLTMPDVQPNRFTIFPGFFLDG